eukprot:g1247.t1
MPNQEYKEKMEIGDPCRRANCDGKFIQCVNVPLPHVLQCDTCHMDDETAVGLLIRFIRCRFLTHSEKRFVFLRARDDHNQVETKPGKGLLARTQTRITMTASIFSFSFALFAMAKAFLPCGGFTGSSFGCLEGVCVDDPRDDCDPANGGADCPGFCAKDQGNRRYKICPMYMCIAMVPECQNPVYSRTAGGCQACPWCPRNNGKDPHTCDNVRCEYCENCPSTFVPKYPDCCCGSCPSPLPDKLLISSLFPHISGIVLSSVALVY